MDEADMNGNVDNQTDEQKVEKIDGQKGGTVNNELKYVFDNFTL